MKRVLCIAVILCLICSAAAADLFVDFNIYAQVFSVSILDESKRMDSDGFAFYESGDCLVTFSEDSWIFVEGKGEEFVPYCMAAIMTLEPNAETYQENAGLFVSRYLLARSGKEQEGTTKGGYYFNIQTSERGLLFMIGK